MLRKNGDTMKISPRCSASALILLLLFTLAACHRVSIDGSGGAIVTYDANGTSFTEPLTAEEISTVVQILNGKPQDAGLVGGVPSCGFSPKISITIDGTTFALAQDGCGMVKNCKDLRYISISDAQQDALEAIFTSRGGTFPCI